MTAFDRNEAAAARAGNQVYYFEVGHGVWRGTFRFRVTSWSGFRAERISVRDRFLVVAMAVFSGLTGAARIDSTIIASQTEGAFGVARNRFRIHRFGLTLYRLDESYTLSSNGRDVQVHARERFGPIPFLFRNEKEHPAEIERGGLRSTYYMPLLGTDWVARYQVNSDRKRIEGRLSCPWAEATEAMDKLPG